MPIEFPEKLSRTDAEAILEHLPDRIRDALIGRAIARRIPDRVPARFNELQFDLDPPDCTATTGPAVRSSVRVVKIGGIPHRLQSRESLKHFRRNLDQ